MIDIDEEELKKQAIEASSIVDQAIKQLKTQQQTVQKIVEKMDDELYGDEKNELTKLMGQLDKHIREEDMISANGIWMHALKIIMNIESKAKNG